MGSMSKKKRKTAVSSQEALLLVQSQVTAPHAAVWTCQSEKVPLCRPYFHTRRSNTAARVLRRYSLRVTSTHFEYRR